MSIRIPVSELSAVQIDTIKKSCILQKIESFFATSKYGKKEAVDVIFVKYENGIYILPFFFAKWLLCTYDVRLVKKTAPWNEYIPSNPMVSYKFTATLDPSPEKHNQPVICDEALKHLQRDGSVSVIVPPGSGKTVMGAYLGSRFPFPVLVLDHLTNLTAQWLDTYRNMTTATIWCVGESTKRTGTVTHENGLIAPAYYLSSNDRCTDLPDVIICNTERVEKIPEAFLKRIGVLVLDEAHRLCTAGKVDCLLSTSPQYIISLTATYMRSDGMIKMMNLLVGENRVIRRRTDPYDVVQVSTNISPSLDAKGWVNQATDLSRNPDRNQIILNIIATRCHKIGDPSNGKDKKAIIMVSRVEHAELLNQLLKDNGYECDYLAGKKKTYIDSQILIGTVDRIGIGFDEKAFCGKTFKGVRSDMLIIACSYKDAALIEQIAGRVFRVKRPLIYYLLDNGSTYAKHWAVAKKFYLYTGGIISYIPASKLSGPGGSGASEDLESVISRSETMTECGSEDTASVISGFEDTECDSDEEPNEPDEEDI
jgi:hypothetical protein